MSDSLVEASGEATGTGLPFGARLPICGAAIERPTPGPVLLVSVPRQPARRRSVASLGAVALWLALTHLLPAAFAHPVPGEHGPHADAESAEVVPPEVVEAPAGRYPPTREAAGEEADVGLILDIDVQGALLSVDVVSSAGADFDAAAVEAVKRYTFRPATVLGQPVRVRVPFTYEFRLTRAPSAPTPAPVAPAGELFVRLTGEFEALRASGVALEVLLPELDKRAEPQEGGAFRVVDLPAGQHLVELRRAQEVLAVAVVEVQDAARTELELSPDEPLTDPFATVVHATYERARVVPSGRVVEGAELETAVRRTADDLLRYTPGLLVVQHGAEGKGLQLFLRGFDAAHGSDLEVSVDGVPINEPSNVHGHGFVDLGFVVPEAVRSLEVLKGSSAVEQGPFALAGSVRFRLGVPTTARGLRLGYEAGTTGRHRVMASLAATEPSDESFVALEGMVDEGFGENRSAARISLLGKLDRRIDANNRLGAWVSAYAARFGLPGTLPLEDIEAGTVGFLDSNFPEGAGESERLLAAFTWEHTSGDSAGKLTVWAGLRDLSLRENYTGFLDDEDGDGRDQDQNGWATGARFDGQWALGSALWALAGAAHRTDVATERVKAWPPAAADAADAADADSRALEVQNHLVGAYGALRYAPFTWLRAEGGARVDLWHAHAVDVSAGRAAQGDSRLVVSPRLNLELPFAGGFMGFLGYGRGLRPPEARSALGAPPDAQGGYTGGEPRFAVSDALEGGLSWTPNAIFSGGVSGFVTWLDGETVYDHVSNLNLSLNATRRLGVEFWARLQPWSWLDLRVDGTWVDARFVDSGAPIPGAPELLGTIQVGVSAPFGLDAQFRTTLVGERALAFGATAAGYAVGDLFVSWRYERLRLFTALENLWDLRWRAGEYHYASRWDRSGPASRVPRIHVAAGSPFQARIGVSIGF